jgi:RimJ/RimL family protein N-acetyltransferase
VESHNLKSIKLIENMGFTEEGRIKDSQPNGDIILYTMAKGDCRFLGDRYG